MKKKPTVSISVLFKPEYYVLFIFFLDNSMSLQSTDS